MYFTEEPEHIRPLRETIRRFVAAELPPELRRRLDREHRFPPELFRKLALLGVCGLTIEEEYGGHGRDLVAAVAVIEELCRGGAFLAGPFIHCAFYGGMNISENGSEAQKRALLPLLARGELLFAYGLSEPGAGSDAGSLKTTARKDGDAYVIDGAKTFITNAPIADVFVIFTNIDPSQGSKGITAFVVQRGTKGLEIGPNDEKMGLHGSTTAQLYFNAMRVPAANRVGAEGQGFKIALGTLDMGRLGLAAHSVGIAQRLLDASVRYAKERKQFGKPIAANQAIQWMLADAATEIHAARLMVYDAGARADRGERITHRAAMTKLFATEMLGRVADNALQIHGGMGYMRELWIERAYRDARITRIYKGTSEVQRMVIAGALLESTE